MLLELATVVGLTVLAPPPEGPAPAPVEATPSTNELAKQKKATSNFLKAGAICLSTGVVPLTLGSVLYGVARQNQLEGSDHEPGVWEGPILMTFGAVLGSVYALAVASGKAPGAAALLSLFQSSTLNIVLLIVAYLIVLGAFGMLAELILSFGWWRLLARSSTIANPDSVNSVRSAPEDRSLIGQGLADALNVGAY